MNVLVVTRGYPQEHNNMLGLFEKDQALALKMAGHNVAYAVVDIRSIRRKRTFGYHHFIDKNGMDVFEMNWPIGPMPRFLIEFFRQEALISLFPYIEKEFGRPDIVHAHFLNYGVISRKLCKKEGLPLVVTEHSSYLNRNVLSSNVKKRAKKTYSACKAIIAVSESLANRIKDISGFDAKVIHNIANVDSAKPVSNCTKTNTCFDFISTGSLIKRKGFDVLIDAFSKVVGSNPNVRLSIYGDGPERNRLKKQVLSLGISDKVAFRGKYNKDDIPIIYENADAFVLASRAETFGVVYIEAMSMGVPVIATRCGGPEDFINHLNGFLIEPNSVEELVVAMNRMIEKRSQFNSEEIKKNAYENFAPQVIARQITEVFEDVIEK